MTMTVPPPKPKQTKRELPRSTELALRPEPSVALMLQKVIDKGITADNVSALESLVGLYDRMQAKDAEKQFAKAFAELQSEMPTVQAIKAVGTQYRYAPYEEILKQVQPFLSKHGFSVSFDTEPGDDRITAICTLRHISGHSQSNRFSVRIGKGPPNTTEPQKDGSAKTYAKRGALSDALNIVIDHDDDARMIGKPIGKALAEDLMARVKATKSDHVAFLKYAGVAIADPDDIRLSDYEQIPDERYEQLDEILRRKEGKLI